MKLHNPGADFFVPDNLSPQEALARVTHLGIGANQDDLEFMAFSALKTCFRHEGGAWFAFTLPAAGIAVNGAAA